MSDEQTPSCPRCHKRKRVIPAGDNVHTFACLDCQFCFENVDDGTIGRGRPDRIAARREEHRLREKQRRVRA